jgi:hypothetical protein
MGKKAEIRMVELHLMFEQHKVLVVQLNERRGHGDKIQTEASTMLTIARLRQMVQCCLIATLLDLTQHLAKIVHHCAASFRIKGKGKVVPVLN